TATLATPTTDRCLEDCRCRRARRDEAATIHEPSPAVPAREVELGRSVARGPRTAAGAQGPPRRRVDGGAPPFGRPTSIPRAVLLRAPIAGDAGPDVEGVRRRRGRGGRRPVRRDRRPAPRTTARRGRPVRDRRDDRAQPRRPCPPDRYGRERSGPGRGAREVPPRRNGPARVGWAVAGDRAGRRPARGVRDPQGPRVSDVPSHDRTGLTEIDLGPDPITRILARLDGAGAAGVRFPEGAAPAPADARGRPAVRHVLIKAVDERGLTFFTNRESRKGRHLAENPNAALALYWRELDRQVSVPGPGSRLGDAESLAYFRTRPREARLGAWASRQSRPVGSRRGVQPRVAPGRG